jgi:hypothetical protein
MDCLKILNNRRMQNAANFGSAAVRSNEGISPKRVVMALDSIGIACSHLLSYRRRKTSTIVTSSYLRAFFGIYSCDCSG